jgi:multiple sugar transport system permease protein
MVPSIVVIVPLFAAVRVMRMADTYWALILPGMFSAYGTFLLRQFFMTIPVELEEAAKMDGAGKLAVYQHVIMPLSKPALATLTTFVFLHTWNDFLWPLIVIDDLGKKTLPIGLAHFQGPYLTDWHLLMAASVMVMLPILVVFVAGQRYFVRGIVLSGLRA